MVDLEEGSDCCAGTAKKTAIFRGYHINLCRSAVVWYSVCFPTSKRVFWWHRGAVLSVRLFSQGTVQQIANGDLLRPLLLECWDYDRAGGHDFIGGCAASIADMQVGYMKDVQ